MIVCSIDAMLLAGTKIYKKWNADDEEEEDY